MITTVPPTLTPPPPTITFTRVPTVTLTPTLPPAPPTATPAPTSVASALIGVGNQIYLWSEPSNVSSIERMVTNNGTWSHIGRTADQQWVQVQLEDGGEGWLMAAGVNATIPWDDLSVTGVSAVAERVVLIPGDSPQRTLYRDDNTVDALPRLQPVIVDAITADGAWLHVSTPENVSGWIASEGVEMTFDPATLQVLAFSPPSESAPAAVAVAQAAEAAPRAFTPGEANVKQDAGGLRLRQLPGTNGVILFNLQAGTPLDVQGRTTDSSWVLVAIPEGFTGWTASQYLDFSIDLQSVAAVAEPEPVPYVELEPPEGAIQAEIAIRQPQVAAAAPPPDTSAGNNSPAANVAAAPRSNIFTTVGDSLTDTSFFLRPLVNGYDLGEYGYLLPTIQYYNINTGYGNAFSRRSFAAKAGWSSLSLFEAGHLAPQCNPGESSVACEFRLTRPAVAIIMIGTNDAPAHSASLYRENMEQVINTALQYGVIPVLSTLPPRADGHNSRILEYNEVIRQLSQQYSTPIVDLYIGLQNLPNQGLSSDGIHLSVPPAGAAGTVNFTRENLLYGTTVRNLTTLQVLHRMRQQLGG